jgi:hypothetical protein
VLLGFDGIDFVPALLDQCPSLGDLDASRQLALVTAVLSSHVRRREEGGSERPPLIGRP